MRRLIWIMVLYTALSLNSTELLPWLDHDEMQGKSMVPAQDNFSFIPFYQESTASSVWAAGLTLTPRLDFTQEYNDNILFTEKNRVDDTVTNITPELHASLAKENYSFTGGGFLKVRKYWDENELDTVDHSFDLSAALQPTPRLTTRASGLYLEDTTLESEIEATGLVLTRNDRKTRDGSAGLSYLLEERTTYDFDVIHRRVEYEDPDLVDYTANVFDTSLTRLMKNERDAITAAFYVADYRFSRNSTQNYGLTLGYRYQITERSALDVAGGARLTRTRIETSTDTIRDKDWGGLANIALSRESEIDRARLGYVLELTPSGRGEVIEKNRIYVTLSHRFSERITGEIYSAYFDSKSQGDITRIDENFFRVRPSLRVRLSEKIWARLVYEHARSRDNRDGTRVDRNRIYLTLTGTWPRKYHSP